MKLAIADEAQLHAIFSRDLPEDAARPEEKLSIGRAVALILLMSLLGWAGVFQLVSWAMLLAQRIGGTV
jgi:hypothetical protein